MTPYERAQLRRRTGGSLGLIEFSRKEMRDVLDVLEATEAEKREALRQWKNYESAAKDWFERGTTAEARIAELEKFIEGTADRNLELRTRLEAAERALRSVVLKGSFVEFKSPDNKFGALSIASLGSITCSAISGWFKQRDAVFAAPPAPVERDGSEG